ncbi:MAG: YhcH/YjgK/YiaL family protein [Brevinema sp.]
MVVSNLERLILDEYTGNTQEAFAFLENYYHDIINESPSVIKDHSQFEFFIETHTPSDDCAMWTSQFRNIQLHLVVEGMQTIEFTDIKHLTPLSNDHENNHALYHPAKAKGTVHLEKGDFVLLYPEDAHRILPQTSEVKKIIFKIALG